MFAGSMRQLPSSLAFVLAVAATASAQPAVSATATTAAPQRRHPAVAAARSAQQAFERTRRLRLLTTAGGTGDCEERIGRLCYWNNNDDARPPAERAEIARHRERLLDRLAEAAEADSTDDWTAGQRVRYLAEARRDEDAVTAAAACRGTRWWCDALSGAALHLRGDHAAAAAAFERSLEAMAPEQRCRWTDVSSWLDGRADGEYRRLACGEARDGWERRFWPLARPLFVLPANDLRNELLTRRVMSIVHGQGANPYAMSWGNDLAEIELRYGWPTAWSARPSPMGSAEPPSIVGHEPTPSYDFLPTDAARRRPDQAAAGDWQLDAPRARARYAPRYARNGFGTLPHQIARFRRGDSTLLVGAWNVEADTGWARGDSSTVLPPPAADSLSAALVLLDTAGAVHGDVRAGLPRRGALAMMAPALPRLASLEVLGVAQRRAARARYAVQPLAPDARLSDILLLTRGAGPAAEIDSVLPDARGSSTVRAGGVVGLYWECYMPATPEAPLTVSVRATRLDTRLGDRVRGVLGLGAKVTPVAVRFTDIGRPDGRPGRSIALSWPSVPAGDYRLELSVAAGADTATVAQFVHVERR
jgi:hypothetical protein